MSDGSAEGKLAPVLNGDATKEKRYVNATQPAFQIRFLQITTRRREGARRWQCGHLTKLMCLLLPLLAVAGSLLIVETRVLGLDGGQAQFYGFIKQLPKRLEPFGRHIRLLDFD